MQKDKQDSVVRQLTDAELLTRLLQRPSATGKQAIWEEFFIRHYNYVYVNVRSALPLRLSHPTIDVDDVVNDVFLEFFTKLEARNIMHDIDRRSRTTAYLRRMLKNIIWDRRRKLLGKGSFLVKEIRLNDRDWQKISGTVPGPETGIEEKWTQERRHDAYRFIHVTLRNQLRGPDHKYLEIISKRLLENHESSYKELAKTLGLTEAAARQRYSRALHKIRKALVREAKQALGKGLWDDRVLLFILHELKD